MYKIPDQAKCSPCHANCKTCSGPSESECLSCTVPLYLNATAPAAAKCISPSCGDGRVLGPGEDCDDGNDVEGDGCNKQCKVEI